MGNLVVRTMAVVALALLAACRVPYGPSPLGAQDQPPPKPNPKNLPPIAAPPGDDWRQFGHDAQRTHVTREALELPLAVAWTYTVEAPAQTVANAIAAAGFVHLHTLAEGNGQGTNSGFRNPWLVTLNGLTGEFRGTFTPQKDITSGHWLAVFEDFNVVYHDDALGAYDCRTFADKRWVGLDRWGPLAVDDAQKMIFHVNNLMADGDPPLIEAHKFTGASLWRQNVWPVKKMEGTVPVHEVNIAGGLCLAAVRYAGTGKNPPKDGLYAFEPQKGSKVWFVEGKFRNLCSGAKRTYALDDGGTLHAYELRDGKEAWSAKLGDVVGAPGLWRDRIVALTSEGLVAMGEDGKILWTVPVEGAATGSDNDTTAMILSAGGRALVCTKEGLALHELEKGAAVGAWKADERTKGLLGGAGSNPIIARGHVYLCGKNSIVALWTASFLRDQATWVIRHAESLKRAGLISEAVRVLAAIEATEGVKDASKKKAAEVVAAIVKEGEKEFEEVGRAKAKMHLTRAQGLCEAIAKKYAGTEVASKASAEGEAIGKQLEDPAVAAEAGFKEAQALEESGKKKEAAKAYRAVMEKHGETEWGQKAAEKYKKLKDYDK